MAWIPELITDGEVDALRIVAQRAWGEDTRYPLWRESSVHGGGQCYVTAVWLQTRLGGFVGKKDGHYVWLSPDERHVIDLTGDHCGSLIRTRNQGYKKVDTVENDRTRLFIKRANALFDNLRRDKV